jgi:hypothetical protein
LNWKEFKINEYFSLRLYDGEEPTIYVLGVPFMQCAFLLLNIEGNKVTDLDEIESIDEAAEKLDTSMENAVDAVKYRIPPDVEFWGHCSNLQVWYEHGYDTRLLHSNLAFPLLRRLSEAGDLLAKKIFQKEIIKRYESGTKTTREFLDLEGFLYELPLDIRLHLTLENDDFNAFVGLTEEIPPLEEEGKVFNTSMIEILSGRIDDGMIKIQDRRVVELNLRNLKIQEFPKSILKFKYLRTLILENNKLSSLPPDLIQLENLEEAWLENNKLRNLPQSICNLRNLKTLRLGANEISNLPYEIGNLKELNFLQISGNFLKRLPDSICKLKKLENLIINRNNLKEIPECFANMESLKVINVRNNPFKELPEALKRLKESKNIEIRSEFIKN